MIFFSIFIIIVFLFSELKKESEFVIGLYKWRSILDELPREFIIRRRKL